MHPRYFPFIAVAAIFFAWASTRVNATADGPDAFRIVAPAGVQNVEMMAKPSTDAAVIASIPASADGLVNLGCIGGLSLSEWEKASEAERQAAAKTRWCRVARDMSIGWVHQSYLSEGEAEEAAATQGGRLNRLAGTQWLLSDFAGEVQDVAVRLAFSEEDRANGLGGCNRFNAGYTEGPGVLTFGPVAATRMACPEPMEKVEQRFFRALDRSASYVATANVLVLFSEDHEVLATLMRAEAKPED